MIIRTAKEILLLIAVLIGTTGGVGVQPFSSYEVIFGWKELDYKFDSEKIRQEKIKSKEFIPANNLLGGMKVSKNRMFITVARVYPGIPATLTYVDYDLNLLTIKNTLKSPPLIPYPNWAMQEIGNCNSFQFVQSMEIDQFNRMWIIDTGKIYSLSESPINKCPPKLVIMDLGTNRVVHTYVFPAEVVSMETHYLTDIVIGCQNQKNCWAYIADTDGSKIVVYNLKKNKSWSVSHSSMLINPKASSFNILGHQYKLEFGVDGIALSPLDKNFDTLYYCPVSSYDMFSVPTQSLQNKNLVKNSEIKLKDSDVTVFGTKSSQSDGLMMDSKGTMFYGMLTKNSVNYWDTNKGKVGKSDGEQLVQNDTDLQWPDTFGFGNDGYLYVTSNRIFKFINKEIDPKEINYRVLRIYTGTKSYMYSASTKKPLSVVGQDNIVSSYLPIVPLQNSPIGSDF